MTNDPANRVSLIARAPLGDGFHEEAGDAAPAAGADATALPVGILVGQEAFVKLPSKENE
jgi:hypothetical protein